MFQLIPFIKRQNLAKQNEKNLVNYNHYPNIF